MLMRVTHKHRLRLARLRNRHIGTVSLTVLLSACLLSGTADADRTERAGPAPALTAANDNIQRSTSKSRDVTGDGWPDIVAREPGVNNGALWVYPHSRTVSGPSTFQPRVLVGTGWNIHN